MTTTAIIVIFFIIVIMSIITFVRWGGFNVENVGAVLILGFLLALIVLPITGFIDWRKNKKSEQISSLNDFLTKYDPILKSKREEAIRIIEETKIKCKELEKSKSKYKSEQAKNKIEQSINRGKSQIADLEKKINDIDKNIELAMVSLDLNKADRSGLKSQEAEEWLESATTIIREANELSSSFDISND
jgi:hypothetical protein